MPLSVMRLSLSERETVRGSENESENENERGREREAESERKREWIRRERGVEKEVRLLISMYSFMASYCLLICIVITTINIIHTIRQGSFWKILVG